MQRALALLFLALLSCCGPMAYAEEDLSLCRQAWKETERGRHAHAIELFYSCIDQGRLSTASLSRTYRNIGIAYRREEQPKLAIAAF